MQQKQPPIPQQTVGLTCVTLHVVLDDGVGECSVHCDIVLPGSILVSFAPQVVWQDIVEDGPQNLNN